MAAAEKTVSALINRQLPDFVRAGSPQYERFLELYYEWLEDETAGNTVYHILRSGEYRDIDSTIDPFIRLFKKELLPYFPETTTLDLVKILKGAREFYVKKGSVESVQWLFRTLFGEDIEVYYPKEQILIASDGKWKLPQAFNLTLSANNETLDVNLLEKHKATGSISKATCIIESANKTIDKTFGNEILELYVSNVDKEFTNGEFLEIPYVDENGIEQLFSERIIGSISGIRVDSAIATDPQQKRRGLLYNVGDPVVVYGGLATTAEANDAVAVVGNVTVGSIEGLQVVFGGYGYRTYSNTEAIVYASEGDDPNANLSTDIRVAGINELIGSTSQNSFAETIEVDLIPIEYLANTLLSDDDWAGFSGEVNLALVQVDTGSAGEVWYNNEHMYANGASFETANFTCKVATSNTGWAGGPQNIILYNIANTVPLTTAGFLVGQNTLIGVDSGATLNVGAIIEESMNVNASSAIVTGLRYETLATGAVALYNIINGGYGFRATPTITTESYYDTIWSENYAYGTAEQAAYRQPLGAFGKIAHIYIDNGGDGYANGDAVTVSGAGYGFSGNVVVDANGTITSVNILNRGEGYFGGITARSVSVSSAGGANSSLTAYGFGEGVEVAVETGAIGRVRDVRMISRGFDYIDEPLVSFKVVDMVIQGVSEAQNLSEGERVYQGATLETAVFQGIVKSFTRSTNLLRLFNYSGNSFSNFNSTLDFTSEGGVTFTVNTAATVPAPAEYPAAVIASGLPNPYWYGNGKAKGVALFYQGLIAFPGFYLNTDGFPSSDKRLQDGRVYQNYSYVIESEKSLSEYKNSLQDIVHPIGTLMLSRTITRSQLNENIQTESKIYLNSSVPANSTVSVANTYSNVVTGANTFFANGTGNLYNVTVGDMLYINDDVHLSHTQVKVITAVNSNTELEVEGDFTFIGFGRLSIEAGNDTAVLTETNRQTSTFLGIGDEIRINTGGIETMQVSAVFANTITLNTTAGNTVSNVVYIVAPDYSTDFTYEIITVE